MAYNKEREILMKKDESNEAKPILEHNTESDQGTQPRRTGKMAALLILVALLALAGGILGGYFAGTLQPTLTSINRNSAQDGNKIVTQEEEDIASVASKVGPSVVSVITSAQAHSALGTSTMQGAGTGIIVSKDGYVLTNKHVVQGSETVSIVTSNGATYKNVKVVGTDPLNDVAFLKIDGVNDLQSATLGDSTSIRIGQKVVAIGNALGEYENTVTSGIISGTGRSVTASLDGTDSNAETLTDLIQTDAAINSGNSGGPLTNITGQVVGINTALASDANSIGFSIPINAVKGALKNLLSTGKVERAYIGVNYVAITPSVAEQYKLSVKKGAYVIANGNSPAVISGSPGAQAGIKEKDIITKVGDVEVGEKGNVSTLVGEYAPGETIALTILRDGKTMTLNVTLAAYKS
jgi:serine protease Do